MASSLPKWKWWLFQLLFCLFVHSMRFHIVLDVLIILSFRLGFMVTWVFGSTTTSHFLCRFCYNFALILFSWACVCVFVVEILRFYFIFACFSQHVFSSLSLVFWKLLYLNCYTATKTYFLCCNSTIRKYENLHKHSVDIDDDSRQRWYKRKEKNYGYSK